MQGFLRAGSPRAIRWRKGELIGSGAYGCVYMGLNLDSGELIAVKQVCISVNNITKERAQAHIQELEEEVKLLRNLSHPNIVCYLGTAREEEALNIFLEFVPGGSISSLLGKFGSFTEPVIRMYTRQLLLGLEYLHSNRIMHRDIKGANILVDNKGCIKLADFGASKKVVELATVSEAKSMKGTPYWMAPEVICQTGHNWQADMWSVGCTVIEMATGKPPWSQQFQEVAALFHIGTTKLHPPIPAHLSPQGKDFLLKCLQREPRLRPSASELLKHPFVVNCDIQAGLEGFEDTKQQVADDWKQQPNGQNSMLQSAKGTLRQTDNGKPSSETRRYSSFTFNASPYLMKRSDNINWASNRPGDSYVDDLNCSVRLDSVRCTSANSDTWDERYNLVSEPSFADGSSWRLNLTLNGGLSEGPGCHEDLATPGSQQIEEDLRERGWSLQQEKEDEVTESKICAFLDEKALELKKLQTPLYEEIFENSIKSSLYEDCLGEPRPLERKMAPLSSVIVKQPSPSISKSLSSLSGQSMGIRSSQEIEMSVSSGSSTSSGSFLPSLEIPSIGLNGWKCLISDTPQLLPSPSLSSNERQRFWKEELLQEIQRKREERQKQLSQQVASMSPAAACVTHSKNPS
ncbi:unnamed protein product [Sphagnum jensenii]|uniref:mitogen-activated protein kinase kinase kinase n=1 Tax=Sphagnum jensenii TaxID=128206 RepID=A0ABP1AUK0_9BRYO